MVQIAQKLKSAISSYPPKKSFETVEKVEVVEEEKEPETERTDEEVEYIKREMESG